MKLGQKNLFYSMVLAGGMLIFLVGYFVYMLPSLYVDHTMEQNLKAVKEQHRAFREQGSYDNVQLKNPTACFSLKIPDKGNSINFTTKMFSADITIKDERLLEMFSRIRSVIKDFGSGEIEFDREKLEKEFQDSTGDWENIFQEIFKENLSMPFEVEVSDTKDITNEYLGEYEKVHMVSEDFIVFEMGVEDKNNRYVNYVGAERVSDGLLLTVLPVVTPDMNEIRPVVFQSLPMLFAVIFLLVLLFSQIYSKGIVTPIEELVWHTQAMKKSQGFKEIPMEEKLEKREDEIGMLSVTIEDLYRKVRESYESLEEKNQVLKEENKRQEVLLRASSHQLKTPISAALLLVEGMKNNVGKYQDREVYLPKVKEQLLSMKKMVEDILYLNHCGASLDFVQTDVRKLLENQLLALKIPVNHRKLEMSLEGLLRREICTDETMFSHILGNLLSNSISYTPVGEKVKIVLSEEKLTIQNFGVRIEEELLPHIFEPFVSGNHEREEGEEASHGLGLYIGAYYAKQLGMKIDMENQGESVVTNLTFQEKKSTP
ncbi:HAMP domain-containing sensor histidine kinase [Roseburia sp. 1XD42-69]|uniref:HAMP domain-containing sensor histidine kinase n=1 Tax=Roseburia sp. 1XD42-69 TaxID=2320088 RepID=UPI000EA156D0|nr:HAMP domain-containing sensor histidine kinase [Roseburia sp. 1XD42-69]RKJ67947.1 sensor histidine kinase [Roseburia sp. 1XD42-69]